MSSAKISQQNTKRITRDEVYFGVAQQFAKRSTCLRKAVGACLVRDNHILGTGYNGAPRGQDECLSFGCLLDHGHCVRTVHAELNALISAAYNGVSTKDSILYTTVKPCFRCELFLINAGVKKIYYLEEYDDGRNNIFKEIRKY
jgi:dCMP deaminase